MSDKTGIEWTDSTWNPVWGCTPVSPGCDHCYAAALVNGRLAHLHPGGFGVVRLRPEQLDKPLRWQRPRRIFVNSMSDLFHDDIPDAFIGTVFEVMARASHHTFQVLTKRHGRMRSLLTRWAREGLEADAGYLHSGRPVGSVRHTPPLWTPPPNVWLGVSVENQQWADIRIPALLDTPAAVRFLSCEPLLGPVDMRWRVGLPRYDAPRIHWVIAGGESGRGARPMDPDWARSLRDQCTAARIPFLFKQWGEWAPDASYTDHGVLIDAQAEESMSRIGKKAAGRELDGRTWDEYPSGAQR